MEGTVDHLVTATGPGLRDRRQFRVRIYVTGTGAVLQLADVVFHSVGSLVVAVGLERAGVTAAAPWPIGRKLPGRLVGVGRVTGRARRRAAMVAGILGRGVYEGHRGPVRIAVTGRAVQRGCHVIGNLARGRRAVVAALTVAGNSGVIEPGRGPGQRTVAGTAFLR